MDKPEIHRRAEAAEKLAESGDTNGLVAQLNTMQLSDRAAVIAEMKQINKQHRGTNSSLPQVDISQVKDVTDTKVDSVNLKYSDGSAVHSTYNHSGDLVSSDYEFADGSRVQDEYDSTGRLKTWQWTSADRTTQDAEWYEDGSTIQKHLVYDRKTGNLISDDFTSKGDTLRKEYYPSGKEKSHHLKTAEGDTLDVVFDSATGNRISQDEVKGDAIVHTEYNATTGKRKVEDSKVGGSAIHTVFDSTTGNRISENYKDATGIESHTEWNPTNGNVISKEYYIPR